MIENESDGSSTVLVKGKKSFLMMDIPHNLRKTHKQQCSGICSFACSLGAVSVLLGGAPGPRLLVLLHTLWKSQCLHLHADLPHAEKQTMK